jgi:hypothetical protein
MLADGLNATELSEREAALNENRAEEAEIFERAAARLRPSWARVSGTDSQAAPPPAANAAALPVEVVTAPQVRPSFTPVPFAPVVNAQLAAAPTVPFASVSPSAFASPAQTRHEADAGHQAGVDPYEAEFEFAQGSRVSRLTAALRGMARQRTALVAAAAACVALGGLWAAFSGDSGRDAARAAASRPAAPVTKPESAPVPMDMPTSGRAPEGALPRAHQAAPVAVVHKPEPAKAAAKPHAKPLVKKQLANKAVAARPVAAKPATRQLAVKAVAPKALARPVAAKKPVLSTTPAAKPSNVTGRLDRSEFAAPTPKKKPLR